MDYLSYTMFMEDSVNTGMDEMNKYLSAMTRQTKDKSEVYKVNYYFRDHLQKPYVSIQLAKSKVRDNIIEFVGTFIDSHSEQLNTSGPVLSFTFGEKEIKPIYELFGVDGPMLIQMYNEVVKETYFGKISAFFTGWVKNAPHRLLLTAILIDAIQNKYEDIIECCEYMWAFTEYPILYREYWPTGVKKELMDYTIEHLGSKFVIKTKNITSLKALLKYDAHSSVTFLMDRLAQGADNIYMDFMQRIISQMNNKLKNISHEYYENNMKNASEHIKGSQFDDGSLADQEGYTTTVSSIVTSTIGKFSTGTVSLPHARAAAQGQSVDKDNLIGYLNQIYSSKDNMIPKFVEDVITAYFAKYPSNTDIINKEFFEFGMKLFRSIGTSKDETYQEVRKILDHWMYDIINLRSLYNREGTISNYTRAVFNYMFLMIMNYNSN